MNFSVVPDTNVLISAYRSQNPKSPNKEFIARWKNFEFDWLYTEDTLVEYVDKLGDFGVSLNEIEVFISLLISTSTLVSITFYHTPPYPIDADDISFLLCAENGSASHLVTHDQHLLSLPPNRTFRICKTISFLQDIRAYHKS